MRELPAEFTAMLADICGACAPALTEALAGSDASLAVRVNKLKAMDVAGGYDAVPWLADRAFYLDSRPLFAADPAWHQGLYYVQDASSMVFTSLVSYLAGEFFGGRPLRYLDACAAPGGKTIAAIEGLPQGSAVLSNEYDRRRASALLENIAKHGNPAVAVSCGDAAALGRLGPVFDIIAVDAPCSGEGMMRKEPEAIRQWSKGLIESCAATQRTILEGVWNALRPGGFLIYSTCTFNLREDEDNVAFLVEEYGAGSVATPAEDIAGVVGDLSGRGLHCCRFMPGLIRGEGLFVSVLRKPEGSAAMPKMNFRNTGAPLAADFARRHVAAADSYRIIETGKNEYSIVPAADAPFFAYLQSKLRLLRCGTPLCTVKGRDAVPAGDFAFSTALLRGSFPVLPLDRAAALAYLHGDSISDIPSDIPGGFILCTYNGMPLGFAKNIGRRANNLYPDAMRLRMNFDASTEELSLVKYPL